MSNLSEKQIRPSARAVVRHQDEILLLKDLSDPTTARYLLPGGGIEFTESARVALRRELMEEVGVDVPIGRFLGCFEQGFIHWKLGQLHDMSLLFLVDISDDQRRHIASQEERYECCWLAVDKLNQVDLVPPELKQLIAFWLKQDLDASFKSSFNHESE